MRAQCHIRTQRLLPGLLTAIGAFVFSVPAFAAITVTVGTDPTKQVLKGTLVTPTNVMFGELVIEGEQVTCVAVDCVDPIGATVFVITDAYIYPGFIDAHNHVAYNVLPKWSPPRLFQNRGQWQRLAAYKTFKQPYNALKDTRGLFCEMVKYGEIKALLSGITTIQGTSPNQNCFRVLIRNVENQSDLGLRANHIRTSILDIRSFRSQINWTITKSFVVHLAEGIDQRSRDELGILRQKGLLRAETAIIHGTAFQDAEFAAMAAVGAKLIWSPQSNRALYGTTTNIPLALNHGLGISLGVDWNATGSDTVFDELRVAESLNQGEFAGVLAETDWLRMITTNPAQALAVEHLVGQLALGLKADIAVLRAQTSNPHTSLLRNHLQDVELVMVGGRALYGTDSVLQKLKPNQCEALDVGGAAKRICVATTTANVPKSTETLETIRSRLLSQYSQLAPLVR